MRRRTWPIALAVLFVAQLVWYLFYTESILQAFRGNAETVSEIYAQVQRGISDPGYIEPWPPAAVETHFQLQRIILESGVPLVLTGPGDTVVAAANLPFRADLDIPRDQDRVREYARRLDFSRPPIGDTAVGLIHFGDPPEVRGLRWIPWLQAGGLFLTAVLALLLIRVQRRAEAERAWTAMARELAHQLGTPVSSLQGWLELLRLDPAQRPHGLGEGEIAGEIGADLDRLERISHRFELIGREPRLQGVELPQILESLRRYLEARLPRLSSGVTLELEVQEGLQRVLGNEVLLTWALENIVKNALDALGGKGGVIRIKARNEEGKRVLVSISDTGPGIPPEIRNDIFEPGVTTKAGGWGVGLALSRRIVEAVHGGRLELGDEGEGATFHLRIPAAPTRGG